MFVRIGQTFINLAAMRSFGFEWYGGDQCVVLRYHNGNLKIALDSEEGAKLVEALIPAMSRNEIEAEFFG